MRGAKERNRTESNGRSKEDGNSGETKYLSQPDKDTGTHQNAPDLTMRTPLLNDVYEEVEDLGLADRRLDVFLLECPPFVLLRVTP